MPVRRFVLTSLILLIAFAGVNAQLPSRYTRYSQALQTLADLEAAYPQVCRLDTMGYSTRDNIPMLRFKISDNVSMEEDEPAVFYCGGVHADEVLGVEVVMWFIQDIMARYALGDSVALRYINELEIFCVPYINPEGHIVVEEGDTDWRKNKCDNDSNGVFDFHDGVDNNRNYDLGFNIDQGLDATTPESLQYKGTAPFTQTENIAMAAFAWRYRPVVGLDYHSPTYGRSEVAYYPWWWWSTDGGHGASPDETMMLSLCRQYCSRIVDDAGDSTYEARRALVDKGDFKTYFYGNFGTVAFSVEISDTTIQDSTLVDDICNRHLPSQYYLLGRALGSAITGIIRDSVTLEPIEAEVQVVERINADIRPRLSRPDSGRYRRLLDPGTYTLRFLKAGYSTRTVNNVVVPSNRPVVVDKLLPPTDPRPPAPVLIFPPQDTILVDTTITFVWHRSQFAQSYLLEIYADSLLAVPLFVDSLVADSSLTPVFQPIDSLVFWRVKGGNQYGWGPYSSIASFVFYTAPPAPVPFFPPRDTVLTDTVMTFAWHQAPSAQRYLLEVYPDTALITPFYIDSLLTDTVMVLQAPQVDTFFCWRVKAENSHGWGSYSPVWSFIFHHLTGASESPIPGSVGLAQNYPNPFNARTAITVELPSGIRGNLSIFDIVGRVVKEYQLIGAHDSGTQRVIWDSRDSKGNSVSSGIYFYRLRVGSSILSRKMILLR
ncbi:MAG: hypothetical protein A2W25_03965 [candidate division Zixibacteria bacterium RBG_16_53_22]|nr:MAG: hypothetical protein A2W25_03965 [candidate division Zixibacteria bacterium RBG_16_53_22]